jgi:hypothetical protein
MMDQRIKEGHIRYVDDASGTVLQLIEHMERSAGAEGVFIDAEDCAAIAAVEFIEPRNKEELNRALAKDIAAGMSLRRAAAWHGTTLAIARRAALSTTGDKDRL